MIWGPNRLPVSAEKMRRETELRQTLSKLPDKRKKKGDDSDVPYLFLLTDVGHVVDDTNNPASLRSGGVANIPGIGGQHRRNTHRHPKSDPKVQEDWKKNSRKRWLPG